MVVHVLPGDQYVSDNHHRWSMPFAQNIERQSDQLAFILLRIVCDGPEKPRPRHAQFHARLGYHNRPHQSLAVGESSLFERTQRSNCTQVIDGNVSGTPVFKPEEEGSGSDA